jgi:hypothetical protein
VLSDQFCPGVTERADVMLVSGSRAGRPLLKSDPVEMLATMAGIAPKATPETR